MKSGSQLFTPIRGEALAAFLLKMALFDKSPASSAVLHATFSLSCLRLGRKAQASAYKASATSLLSTALETRAEVRVAFQNIATSMLLCTYEVHGPAFERSSRPLMSLTSDSSPLGLVRELGLVPMRSQEDHF